MNKITNTTELQARIIELQNQRIEEGLVLKNELSIIVENVNPIEILTNGLKKIINSPEVKHELFALTLGMSAGYIAKKIVIGQSESIFQRIAGNVLGMVVSKNVTLNLDTIQAKTLSVLKNIITKKKSVEETDNDSKS